MPFRQEPPRSSPSCLSRANRRAAGRTAVSSKTAWTGRAPCSGRALLHRDARRGRRVAHSGIDLIYEHDPADSAALLAEN